MNSSRNATLIAAIEFAAVLAFPFAGVLRQSVLRRQEAKPPVHDREPIALRGLCRDPGRAYLLKLIDAGIVVPGS